MIIHPSAGALELRLVEPEHTYLLRQQVLRPHQRVDEMALHDSVHPEAVVIGAVVRDTGEVVSTASIAPKDPRPPLEAVLPAGRRWRLRSMATRPDLRGSGIGSAVLAAAIGHVSANGGGILWCNARMPAVRFYERAGFVTFGTEWVDALIGAHILMWRAVPSSRLPQNSDC